jgi:hypothetical protein
MAAPVFQQSAMQRDGALTKPVPPQPLPKRTDLAGAGNRVTSDALAGDADLLKVQRATEQLAARLKTSKGRRDDQSLLDRDQIMVSTASEAMGSLVSNTGRFFRGKEMRRVVLPEASLWSESDQLLLAVQLEIVNRNPVRAARALGALAEEFTRAESVLNDYLATVIDGAEISTTGLQVAAVAGAIAATVATGGVASGAAVPMLGITAGSGLGLLGTSAAVGVGAGTYGVAQEEGTQVGEMIAGTRAEFDIRAIAMRGGRDAVLGFVGALAGGALSKYAIGYFGRLALARMSPAQIAAVSERLGIEAALLTPEAFLRRGQQLLIDFFAGAATTPITTAVESVFALFEGKEMPSAMGFSKMVIDNAVQGGLLQLFLTVITHRHTPKSGTNRKRPIPLPDAPPEMPVQRTAEATADLHTSTGPEPVPDAMPTEPLPENWLQSQQESTADLQSQYRNEQPVPMAEPIPAAEPVPLQTQLESLQELQVEAGVPTPSTGQPEIGPEAGGKPKQFRRTAPAQPVQNPRSAVLEQSGPATRRNVAPGEMIDAGKATPTLQKPVSLRGKQRGISPEEQLYDVHDSIVDKSQKRRSKADKLRHEAERAPPAPDALKVGDPDPAFPGRTINALHEDHIVPARTIRDMKGFAQLDEASQLSVLNMPENLEFISDTVNLSRLDTPYKKWSGETGSGLKADPAWIAKMAQKEAQLTQLIQDRINELLRAQVNRQHWLRLGMPEGKLP